MRSFFCSRSRQAAILSQSYLVHRKSPEPQFPLEESCLHGGGFGADACDG